MAYTRQKTRTLDERREIVRMVGDIWCARKSSVEEACKAAGISHQTLRNWRNQDPVIATIWERYQYLYKDEVYGMLQPRLENELLKWITGFFTTDVETHRDADGNIIKTVEKRKEHPGDPQTVKWFLSKVAPQLYGEFEHTGANTELTFRNDEPDTPNNRIPAAPWAVAADTVDSAVSAEEVLDDSDAPPVGKDDLPVK